MTFRERVDASPVGWLIGVGAVAFVTGILVTLGIMQVLISDRGPRESRDDASTSPTIKLQTFPTVVPAVSITSSPSAEDLGMTAQEFAREFEKLQERFAEKEAFIARMHEKRVRWILQFRSPISSEKDVAVYFEVQSDDPGKSYYWFPVKWANFPLRLRDRIYALQPGDLIEVEGILTKSLGLSNTSLIMNAENFVLIAKATPTPSATQSPSTSATVPDRPPSWMPVSKNPRIPLLETPRGFRKLWDQTAVNGFAEQAAFVDRYDNARVKWIVAVDKVLMTNEGIVEVIFRPTDVPPLTFVSTALFEAAKKEELMKLRRGDRIVIHGVLKKAGAGFIVYAQHVTPATSMSDPGPDIPLTDD